MREEAPAPIILAIYVQKGWEWAKMVIHGRIMTGMHFFVLTSAQ
jgi:hypothetical protein